LIFRTDADVPVVKGFAASGALASGTEVYVSGYGKSAASVYQGLLKEIKTVSIPYDVCREFFYTSLPPSYGIFCANPAEINEDTCTGDGGAPAVTYDATADLFTLVGLNFGGSSDCSGSMPLVFVDIAVYKHWIESVTNGCCGMLFTL
jgi:secreted trypsin-like serine protease